MSIPYIPQGTNKRFHVPRTLAADFDAFLNRDIPNTNMDFEVLKSWYDREKPDYQPSYVRGEIYPDSTKSRYENTDNNMNIRCSVSSGIRKGDMLVQPNGEIFILDWAVALQSNNAPSRALRCNMFLKIEEKLDEDIATMVRRKFNISIGMKTAAQLKNNLAFMINGPRLEQKVFGIHTLSGLPKSDMIPALAVSVSVLGTIDRIVDEIRSIVDRTPPMIRRDIMKEGIFLTGGVSLLQNLPIYIQKEISLPVYHIQDPKNSTIRGLVTMINQKELYPLMRSPRR